MSSSRRPWYPWYPKDFIVDEKVQALSPIAELLYRRALDVMWQANACQLPDNCQKLANQIGKGLSQQEFEKAWSEIQFPGFELFKKTEDGLCIYSKRLREEAQKIESIQEKRKEFGKKGGLAKATAKAKANGKQNGSHTDTYTDSNNTPLPPNGGKRLGKGKIPKSLIPDPFLLTEEMRTWFNEQGFKFIEVRSATAEFVDYWRGKGTAMKDWVATWRNGMRQKERWAIERGQKQIVAQQILTPKPYEPSYVD